MSANFTPEMDDYKEIKKGPIFIRFVLENFPLLTDDFDAMTYYGALCKIVDYMKKLIDNESSLENNMTALYNAYNQLQDYVNHYFDNLDIQEEINNKLDEMAESGQLTDIIAQYLQLAGVLAYDTKTAMKTAQNLTDGSITKTLGSANYKDGKGSFYKVRQVQNTDVIDDENIVALNDPDLIAEKINDYNTNIRIKTIYEENANIYITELKNVTDIEVLPTNGDTSTPGVNNKNLYDYIKDNGNDFDLLINSGLGNMVTGVPVGYTIYSNGASYDNGNHTSTRDVVGFDENNNLMSVNEMSVSSISDIEALGFVKCVAGFQTLIKNGEVQQYSIDLGNGLDNFIGQLYDGSYIIVVTMARTPFNNPIEYDDVVTIVQNLYPNIKTLCVLDGGGSTQQYTKTMSVIPSTDVKRFMGRPVPTLFKFKVGGVNNG